jgi:alkylation response protein AidB-like acyl-CoA dehydrogenase
MIRNPEQFEQLIAQVRRFIRDECIPLEEAVDRSDEIPRRWWTACANWACLATASPKPMAARA